MAILCAALGLAAEHAGTHARPARYSFRGGSSADGAPRKQLLVVGSANADVIVEVERLPASGETVCARGTEGVRVVPGGKGCNQAIAVSRLGQHSIASRFIGQLGADAQGEMLEATMAAHGVDVSGCGRQAGRASGQGFVFLQPNGTISSVVVEGANGCWPSLPMDECVALVQGCSTVLLQREVPEEINEAIASAAAALGVPVLQDIGGADRPISDAHLQRCALLSPNKPELARLTGLPVETEEQLMAAVNSLRDRGARRVLVTLGAQGSLLVGEDGSVLRQPALPIPGGVAIDETGAGDCFRAAFAVAMAEGRAAEECMRFAAAAGALAVSRLGAVPSIPSREEVEALVLHSLPAAAAVGAAEAEAEDGAGRLRGGAAPTGLPTPPECGLEFGSRLNSMKDRPELWEGAQTPLGWVARQGQVQGLGVVDFNFPQHLSGLSTEEVQAALTKAGLRAGAICLRYPKHMQAGAMTHPDERVRAEAIALTIEAGEWAKRLGAEELIIWSAYDGYDYSLQVDYGLLWQRVVDGFRAVCDAHPELKVSLEFKPTDENTRWFAVPSTGAALLLVRDIDRNNMGLTIDLGHCLAAGENPAQSIAMVGRAGKLFGLQLNDGYQRLGAEDGLMFGSVHPLMALEVCYWLQEVGYDGHVYFDTFPRNEDPVREAEFNIRAFKRMWAKAKSLRAQGIEGRLRAHDALGTLEMLERMEAA
mmetsp:Transcript_39287/g.97325  ORF Transcript_39287/g.97325 Transcript_39287/m.97325 type:complete len:708 (-) Transcript_39287:172-2295(-)